MWWPLYVMVAGGLSLLALSIKDHVRAIALMVVLLGLMALQFAKAVLAVEAVWVADAMIWIVASVAIQRLSSGNLTLIAVLLLAAGLCIPVGRFAGEEYAIGSVALLFSDLFGVAALVSLGGPVIADAFKHICRGISNVANGRGIGGLRGGVHSKGLDE